ncbi:ATP-binding protein [Pontibacillus litoralis]|nr:ATP-binding protein [Pontibacillus litoralis]
MTKKRIFIIIGIFLFILTSLRIGWIVLHNGPDSPQAINGTINLSESPLPTNKPISLDGEWEFYPNQLIDPGAFDQNFTPNQSITVPGNWNAKAEGYDTKPAYGYGTYRLKVILPEVDHSQYGILIDEISGVSNVYINGRLKNEFTDLPTSPNQFVEKIKPQTMLFESNTNEIEIVLHVSNTNLRFKGGITQPILFGTDKAIIKESYGSITLQVAIFVVITLHSFYAFTLWFMGKQQQRELFYFGFMLAITAVISLVDDDMVIQLPINIEMYHRILTLLMLTQGYMLLKFIEAFFQLKTSFIKTMTVLYRLLCIGYLVVPFHYYIELGFIWYTFHFLLCFFLFKVSIIHAQKGNDKAIYILLFITSYTSNFIWNALVNADLIYIPYYPFDYIISIFAIAMLLFTQHRQAVHLNKQQTIELQKADKMKDDFLANTSHELRNPLHGMINIAQVVLTDESTSISAQNKENLELLIQVGQRMTYTLNDILDVTKLKEHTIKLNKEPIQLHAVCSSVLHMIHFMTERKNVQFNLHIPSDFPAVYADEHRLIQIFINLLHNAIKHTDEGAITIEATSHNGMATIIVRDTGIGIKEELHEEIFQPYGQADSSVTSISGGIGLGLSICKQLVQLHDGSISLQSSVGEGSTFSFTLPLAKEDNVKAPNVVAANHLSKSISYEQQASSKKKANVLIVDDDPVNNKVLLNILYNDYNVTTSTNGNDALQLIEKERFDLIISDVMMPQMSGYEVTQHIRKTYTLSELPIILLTARHQIEDISTGFRCGANDYVSKPVDALELKARVSAHINVKLTTEEQLRMEAAWLQAQIRPHFLFNTLNTIVSLSEIDSSRMIDLLHHFATYLRRSFDVGNATSTILLSNEMQLIDSYIYIEKQRFGNRLSVEWNIDEYSNIYIPPLTIQPLVENAIRHGVLQRAEGGKVTLEITNQPSSVKIAIIDNGVGMEPSFAERLLKSSTAKQGIGVSNTHKRLKKMYGNGLTIETFPNQGTTIHFSIPK